MKKYSIILSLGLLTMGLTSCLKDDLVSDQKYGMINVDAYKVAQLPSTAKAFSLLLENKTTVLDFVEVNLAASEPAEEDVVVTLSIDQTDAKISAYNTANGASLVRFPSAKYTLPNALKVTIPKGSRSGFLKLSFNQQDLDPAHPYALAFNIVSVDKPGYVVSGNNNTTLARISAKNAYEGAYTANGFFTHPVASSSRAITNRAKSLTTVNATTSRIELGDLGTSSYYMYIRVNADNSVTILPDPTAVAGAQDVFATGINSYNPTTKTFTLNYAYNVAAPRIINEVVKKN
ncbi:BT_3987 domain-containing protein [Pedobacter frigidisoli]|uniref:BT_3987 domain-containing protein n=1 Tax=Pedobacter frigidisoli TaxID=2530455 RepID=UPI00292DEAEF|nr:DUF1735 domain-containing protein [Pedobacter frigidisoli]